MSLPVFLHAGPFAAGGSVVLDGDEGRHAATVKRMRVGEYVGLTDGLGARATAVVVATAKASLDLRVEEVVAEERPAPSMTVVQAIPKGDRGELAVEVLTEVGADTIVPWAAARCVAVWKGERSLKAHARWAATARSAAKQARRAWWPAVAPLASTADVAGLVREADLAVVLHEEAVEPLAALPVEQAGSLLVVVGPEGGLTDEEVAAFADAGAHVVRLGSEVLRTSTAGVAAVSALLARTSRWA